MFGPGTWSDLITDVDQVDFFYGDPTSIFLFLSWDVGLDNARITFADCNGNQLPDSDDIQSGFSLDLDLDGTPDECQPLSADTASISLSSGGAQNLAIDAGAAVGGDTYWVFGSATGTSPGVNFGGVSFFKPLL